MKVNRFIARKYFFSRKNPSAINIITGISLVGYAIGALAMIVLLSALNGFEESIFGDYQRSSPDFKIVPLEGKVFEKTDALSTVLNSEGAIAAYSFALEDKAIIKYGDQQLVGIVRGVDSALFKVYPVDSWIKAGSKELNFNDAYRGNAWLSEGLVYTLNVGSSDQVLEVLTPDRTSSSMAQTTLNQEILRVSSMVHLSSEENEKTLIVPMWVAQNLFVRENEYSSVSVRTKESAAPSFLGKLNERLKPLKLKALNRQEQNETMYKMFNTEKWFSVALLMFVLLLISFNLYGALQMMKIDKGQDLYILNAMGLTNAGINGIFRMEALLVAGTGTVLGLFLGVILILLQQRFGIVTTQATFEMVYPVSLKWTDMVLVGVLNTLTGWLSGWSLFTKPKR